MPEYEELAGKSAVYSLSEMLIFGFRCKRIFSVAEMKIYTELSIAFNTCFVANREIVNDPKRKGALVF